MTVISLSNIIKEISEKRSNRSWLSPDGKFFDTSDKFGQIISHETAAMDILDDYLGYEIRNQNRANEMPSTILFKKGWQRIAMGSEGQFSPKVMHCNNPYRRPNSIQMRELIDMAIEYNIGKIMYDDGTSKGYVRNVIWDKQDF